MNVYHPILLILPNRADRHRESSTSGIVVERATRARREGRAVTLGRLCLGLEAHGPGAAEGDADDGLAPAVARVVMIEELCTSINDDDGDVNIDDDDDDEE